MEVGISINEIRDMLTKRFYGKLAWHLEKSQIPDCYIEYVLSYPEVRSMIDSGRYVFSGVFLGSCNNFHYFYSIHFCGYGTEDSSFRCCYFESCDFRGANFVNCDFRGAVFPFCRFSDTSFLDCQLDDFSRTQLMRLGVSFSESNAGE